MNRKLAENWITTNDEYSKLRGRGPWGTPFRRSFRGRAADARGLERPELETWTTEELRRAAATLGVPATDVMPREALVEALLSAELASVLGSRQRR